MIKLNESNLKKLLRKCDCIRYDYYTNFPSWCYDAINNVDLEIEYIMNDKYNLDAGVYLYKLKRNYLILIAKISNKGIKIYDSAM